MRPEIVSVGTQGGYAVDWIINGERFRVHYFSYLRVNPLKDAQEWVAKLGEAIKNDSEPPSTAEELDHHKRKDQG